jgi:hypothetical protein
VYVFWNVSIISYVFYWYTRDTDGRGKPASYLLVAMGPFTGLGNGGNVYPWYLIVMGLNYF